MLLHIMSDFGISQLFTSLCMMLFGVLAFRPGCTLSQALCFWNPLWLQINQDKAVTEKVVI